MMIIALIMRPWLKMVKHMGAEGRVLADDVLVTAAGEGHAEAFERVYDATHEYMQDMGVRFTLIYTGYGCHAHPNIYRIWVPCSP